MTHRTFNVVSKYKGIQISNADHGLLITDRLAKRFLHFPLEQINLAAEDVIEDFFKNDVQTIDASKKNETQPDDIDDENSWKKVALEIHIEDECALEQDVVNTITKLWQASGKNAIKIVVHVNNSLYSAQRVGQFFDLIGDSELEKLTIAVEGMFVPSDDVMKILFHHKAVIHWSIKIDDYIGEQNAQRLHEELGWANGFSEYGIPVFPILYVGSQHDVSSILAMVRTIMPRIHYAGISALPAVTENQDDLPNAYIRLLSALYKEYFHNDVNFMPLNELAETVSSGSLVSDFSVPRSIIVSFQYSSTSDKRLVYVCGKAWQTCEEIITASIQNLYGDLHEFLRGLLNNLHTTKGKCQFFHICPCQKNVNNTPVSERADCAYKRCFVSAFLWQKYFASQSAKNS